MSNVERSKIQEKEYPPNPNQRIKKWSWTKLIRKDGKWVYKRVNRVREYDRILQRWIEKPSKTTVEYISLEEKGISKSKRVKVIYVRTALDPLRTVNVSNLYLAELKCEIPSGDPANEHFYLSTVKGRVRTHGAINKWLRGVVVMNDFAKGTAEILPFNHRFVTQVGEVKKISQKEADALIESGEVFDMFNEPLDSTKDIRRFVYNKQIG